MKIITTSIVNPAEPIKSGLNLMLFKHKFWTGTSGVSSGSWLSAMNSKTSIGCIVSLLSKDSMLCSSKCIGATWIIREWLCTGCNSNVSCCCSLFLDLAWILSVIWAEMVWTFIGRTDFLYDIFLITIFIRPTNVIQQQIIPIIHENLYDIIN